MQQQTHTAGLPPHYIAFEAFVSLFPLMRQLQLGIQRVCRSRNCISQSDFPKKDPRNGRGRVRPTFFSAFSTLLLFATFLPSNSTAQTFAADRFDAVHSGDIIEVDVEGSLDHDWRGGLTPEGLLNGFNEFGEPIKARCRMPSEIAADAVKALSSTLRDPKVNVFIVDRSNRMPAILDGAVRAPHRYQIKRPVRLRELIVRSGGITDSSGGTISVFRPDGPSCPASDGKEQSGRFEIKIPDLVSGLDEANPFISPGDLIVVEKALPIYAIGGVRSPRPIPSKEQIMLTSLIAMAGGVAKDGDERRVVIYRRSKEGPARIEADLKKIADGTAKDVELQPLDIVEVMTKGGDSRKYPPEIAAAAGDKHATLPLVIIE